MENQHCKRFRINISHWLLKALLVQIIRTVNVITPTLYWMSLKRRAYLLLFWLGTYVN